jgi:hypothetical protein
MSVKVPKGLLAGFVVFAVIATGYIIVRVVAARSPSSPETLAAIKRFETNPKGVTAQDREIWASLPADQRRQIGQDAMNKAMGGSPGRASKQ